MGNISTKMLALGGTIWTGLALSQPVVAQDASQDEIVVTAAKRSENVQSVPISVSAIGGDALAKSHISNVDSLVTKVANLQL